MKSRKFAYLTIFIFVSSIFAISATQARNTGETLSFNNSVDKITSNERTINQILDRNIEKIDQNRDKISDYIELEQGEDNEIIVIFDDFSSVPQIPFFQGYEIDSFLKTVPAIKITVPSTMVEPISALDSVKFIEHNAKLEPKLFRSTQQFGVRPEVWDLGYNGSSDQSIAVVDSGIDSTHAAFDNVIANYNALDGSSNADDDVSHGTHVASIAAGNQDLTTNTVKASSRGLLPEECDSRGCLYYIDYQLKNIDSTNNEVTITMDWGAAGADNPGSEAGFVIFNPIGPNPSLACETCSVTSTTGFIEETFTLPAGSYVVGFTNVNNAFEEAYETYISYPVDSQLPLDDDYPKVAGVSPSTNLVNIKVVDALGNGDVDTFDTAMDWIIQNKDVYNITVVNLSIGITTISAVIDSSIGLLADNGIISVVAAGNEGTSSPAVFSPGSAPEAITVGAVNSINELTYYSSNGSPDRNGEIIKPDVLAPGGSSASTALGFETDMVLGFGKIMAADANIGANLQENDLIGYEGTSMATPHVSGLASLMVQYLRDQGDWAGSRDDVLKVKRAILANTFEVANIGQGRVSHPSLGNDIDPTLDRIEKDYQEGWGAIDAAAAFNMLSNNLAIGDTRNFDMTFTDPLSRHVYSWKLTAQPGTNYGLKLDVPSSFDADLLLIKMNEGPIFDGNDYGDLIVDKFSTNGVGEDESIGFNVAQTTEFIVVVRAADGSDFSASMQLTVIELDQIPEVDIISPIDGAVLENNDVEIQFTSSSGIAMAFLDDDPIGQIQPGYILEGVSNGEHRLKLVETLDGIDANDIVSFTVRAESDNGDGSNFFDQLSFPSIYIMIPALFISVKIIKKRRR